MCQVNIESDIVAMSLLLNSTLDSECEVDDKMSPDDNDGDIYVRCASFCSSFSTSADESPSTVALLSSPLSYRAQIRGLTPNASRTSNGVFGLCFFMTG